MIGNILLALNFSWSSRVLTAVAFFFFLVSGVPAQTRAKPFASEVGSTIQAAQKEGSLNLSWGTTTMGGPSGVKELEQAFNKYYGTNIQFRYTPGRSYSAHTCNGLRKNSPPDERPSRTWPWRTQAKWLFSTRIRFFCR